MSGVWTENGLQIVINVLTTKRSDLIWPHLTTGGGSSSTWLQTYSHSPNGPPRPDWRRFHSNGLNYDEYSSACTDVRNPIESHRIRSDPIHLLRSFAAIFSPAVASMNRSCQGGLEITKCYCFLSYSCPYTIRTARMPASSARWRQCTARCERCQIRANRGKASGELGTYT